MKLNEWVQVLSAELGIDPKDTDITAVLDLARDAAHGIARPAAPLTTFLAGYAAGRSGGGPAEVTRAIETSMATVAATVAAERADGDRAAPPG